MKKNIHDFSTIPKKTKIYISNESKLIVTCKPSKYIVQHSLT